MIKVKNLTKDFTLNKKQRKEMGDDFKETRILRAVDNNAVTNYIEQHLDRAY